MVDHGLCEHGLVIFAPAASRDWIMLHNSPCGPDGYNLARSPEEGFGRKAHKL